MISGSVHAVCMMMSYNVPDPVDAAAYTRGGRVTQRKTYADA